MWKIQRLYQDINDIITLNKFQDIDTHYPIECCKYRILEQIDDTAIRGIKHMPITGIYRISRNNHSYIGKSINILRRWDAHVHQSLKNDNSSFLYRTMHKYLSEFTFEILEVIDVSLLNEREAYWIAYYDSYYKGFNRTFGGDGVGIDFKGERHYNCKTSEAIVKEIRNRYNDKKDTKREVYEDYKHLMSMCAFTKIWSFQTWQHIHPEFQTAENAKWHATHMKFSGNANPRKLLTTAMIAQIRHYLDIGMNAESIYELYFSDFLKKSFMKQLHDIMLYSNQELQHIHDDKLTQAYLTNNHITAQDVVNIRELLFEGYLAQEVFPLFAKHMSEMTFYQIWNGKVARTIKIDVYNHLSLIHQKRLLRKYQLSVEEVHDIRQRHDSGEMKKSVYDKYRDRLTIAQFNGIWSGRKLTAI